MSTRRLTFAGMAVCAAFALPGAVQAQGALKIGFVSSLSGPFTPWGINVRDGMKMAADEINAAGGVLGRKVEIVERDDKNNPNEAITAFRFLVEREGIIASGGVISSDVGLALSREAETLQVPVFLTMSGSHAILKKASRYTFRTCLPAAPENMEAVAMLIRDRKLTRIGVIAADYAWGHSLREAVEALVKPMPGVRLQVEVAPVPEKDFTPYLRKLQALDPELIIATGHPPGAPTIVRQVAELGMKSQILGPWHVAETMMQRVGDQILNRFVDYSCVDFEHATYRQLAERFFKTYKRLFDNNAFSGYTTVKMVADAAQKARSADPKAVGETVRKGTFDQPGYGWPLSYTEWGEMRVSKPLLYVFEKGDPGAINPGAAWRPKVTFRSAPLQPYVPKE